MTNQEIAPQVDHEKINNPDVTIAFYDAEGNLVDAELHRNSSYNARITIENVKGDLLLGKEFAVSMYSPNQAVNIPDESKKAKKIILQKPKDESDTVFAKTEFSFKVGQPRNEDPVIFFFDFFSGYKLINRLTIVQTISKS